MVFVNPNLINKGVILSAIAFTSFSVGYHSTNKFIPCKRRRPYNKALQKVFTCMQLCSFFIWFITLTPDDFSGESYLTSGEAGQGSDDGNRRNAGCRTDDQSWKAGADGRR